MKKKILSIFIVALMFLMVAPNREVQAEKTFKMEIHPDRLTVYQGDYSWIYVNVSSVDGFFGTVKLQVIGSPDFLKVALWPSEIQLSEENWVKHSSTMLYAEPYAQPGSYILQVVGMSGNIRQEANITVELFEPIFTVQVEPSSQKAVQGEDAVFVIALRPFRGAWSLNVSNLSVSGIPPNATYDLNPQMVGPWDLAVLTVNVGEDTPAGEYAITVTATYGAGSRSGQTMLKVEEKKLVEHYVSTTTVYYTSAATSGEKTVLIHPEPATVALLCALATVLAIASAMFYRRRRRAIETKPPPIVTSIGWRCPSCGAVVQTKFCTECGAKVRS